jgi:hypothetical protein
MELQADNKLSLVLSFVKTKKKSVQRSEPVACLDVTFCLLHTSWQNSDVRKVDEAL